MSSAKLHGMCVIPKCGREATALGMCFAHLQRWYRGVRGPKLLLPIRSKRKPGVPAAVRRAIEEAK
jgi:hypothetical protein